MKRMTCKHFVEATLQHLQMKFIGSFRSVMTLPYPGVLKQDRHGTAPKAE